MTRRNGREVLCVCWSPQLPNGLLVYNGDNGLWEQDEAAHEGEKAELENENLILQISDDGLIQIWQGDDDLLWLNTSIEGGDELTELMEFYASVKASKIGSSSCSPKPLSELIEEVFLLVPQSKGHARLLRLRGQVLLKEHPEVAAFVDAWLTDDWTTIMKSLDGQWNFGEWLDKNALRASLGQTEEIRLGDLILTGCGTTHYAGMLMAGAESDVGYTPALVLRPKAKASRMWLTDYFEHATEADGLVERICKSWQYLPKGLNNISAAFPSVKRDQVAASIERRTARYGYLSSLKAAMRMREPFDQIAKIYQKRARAAQGLHTELLDDLEAIQHPLPFFLEYPYRTFRLEDDHLKRLTAGKRLLAVLAKVPLYLVIEELIFLGDPLGKELIQQLTKSPLSDGSLVDLHADVAHRLGVSLAGGLNLFGNLIDAIADNSNLLKLVAARNRYHHEPFDDIGFLKAMDEAAYLVIDRLRSALEDCRFVVPSHTRVADGEKIVAADDACSADAHFRQVELNVSLPLESFPSGELLVYRRSPESCLVLRQLLSTKLVTEKARDFGLFDRVENGEAKFTLLRSD